MAAQRPPRVVVGIEDPGNCGSALAFAAHEARLAGLQVALVHVGIPAAKDVRVHHSLEDAMAALRELTAGALDITCEVRPGRAAEVLPELSHQARLLVVQHRRLSRLTRHRIPSTAVAVAARVRSRIVSVPEDWTCPPGSRGRIAVGVDAVDEEAEHLLDVAFVMAAAQNTRLLVLHGWAMTTAYDDALVDATMAEEWRTTYRTRLDAVLEPLRARRPGVQVDAEVVHKAPAKALVQQSASVDLLIIGQGRLVHPLVSGLGSVARAVLEDSACPVEVVGGASS
jgi:nucleotide-binding universal stress UspA family protein